MKTRLIFLLLFAPFFAPAQKHSLLEGEIRDATTGAFIEGAVVQHSRTGERSFTTEQGRFVLKGVAASDSLFVSALGYAPLKLGAEAFIRGNRILQLSPRIVQLQEMTVLTTAYPGSQLIGRLDRKIRSINNAQEVLQFVPGLFIGQHAGGGKAEQIFVRGFDVDHGTDVALSVDNMPVNMVSHAHGQGYADLHFVIPETIEHIAFRKGHYQADKGNFTTAGFVSLHTKNSLAQNSVKAEAGQFNTLRTVGLFNLLNKTGAPRQQSAYVAVEYLYTNGYFDQPQHFNRYNLFGKYNSRIGQHSLLSLSLSGFHSQWHASGQIPDRAVKQGLISFFGELDPNEGGKTGRYNAHAALTTNFANGGVLKNQVYYTRYYFELFSNFTFFLIDPVHGDLIRQKEKRDLAGYNGSYSKTTYAGTRKLTHEAGAGLRVDVIKDSELSRMKNRSSINERIQLGDIRDINAAAYVSETVHWNQRLTFNASLRADQFFVQYTDKLQNNAISRKQLFTLNPKLNLYYQWTPNTELYVSAGKGFHANDTRVAVRTQRNASLPSAYGADWGINSKLRPNLFVNAALWYLFLEQEFVYVGDEGIVEPGGKSLRKGVDLSLRYQPFNRLFVDVDANYAHGRLTEAEKGSDYIPLAPRFTSTGSLTYKSDEGWNGSIRYRYMGNRAANEENSVQAKGYFVTDASLFYTQQKFEAGLSVQNLFNTRWKETQFDTESRLKDEPQPVSEIHFTPGTPFFLRASFTYFF